MSVIEHNDRTGETVRVDSDGSRTTLQTPQKAPLWMVLLCSVICLALPILVAIALVKP
jgi:hypothetical protein